jgi:hypothetical protein
MITLVLKNGFDSYKIGKTMRTRFLFLNFLNRLLRAAVCIFHKLVAAVQNGSYYQRNVFQS